MKPVEILPASRSRPVGADAAQPVAGSPARTDAGTAMSEPEMVSRSGRLSAGASAPVDAERVAQIRSAIRDGSYPLVPTSVADAMIAAGYLLTEGKKDT